MRSQGRTVPIITIRAGEGVSTILIALSMLHGVLPLSPVLLTCRKILDVHALLDTACATISFVVGFTSIGGGNIIDAIPRFVGGGKIGMVRQLNNFCSKIMLLA